MTERDVYSSERTRILNGRLTKSEEKVNHGYNSMKGLNHKKIGIIATETQNQDEKKSNTDNANVPCSKCRRIIKENLLIILTLIGVIIGFVVGFSIRPANPSEYALLWIGLPGEMYMRMLKFCILPLIVSSVIAGTSSLGPKSNGKISTVVLLYIAISNVTGVLLGAVAYLIFRPGDGINIIVTDHHVQQQDLHLDPQDLFLDLIRNIFPDNIVTACFQTAQTVYVSKDVIQLVNGSNVTVEELIRASGTTDSMNILGLIVISSMVGMAASLVGDVGRPFVKFFLAASAIIIQILRWIVWFTPIGVASLIAAAVAEVDDIEGTFATLGIFVLAVSSLMLLLIFVVYPLLYFVLVRGNPLKFIVTCFRPLMTSFATASSSVAIPDMMFVCETYHNVDVRISRFVIPFGDALNRTGSVAYIFIAAVFLCKLDDVDIDNSQFIFIMILTAVSSFAIPAIPSAAIITIIIILSSVNVQPSNIGLLMALDWLLDRIRTGVNCMGIICGGIVTNHFCKKSLDQERKGSTASDDTEI